MDGADEYNGFFIDNFQTAFKIHELCDTLGFSVDHARLFTYINILIEKNDGDLSYFDKEDPVAVQTLEFLLNKRLIEVGPNYAELIEPLNSLPERIKAIDNQLCEKYGIEFRLQSELLNRLRLHTDAAYRKKMMTLYSMKILPCLECKETIH